MFQRFTKISHIWMCFFLLLLLLMQERAMFYFFWLVQKEWFPKKGGSLFFPSSSRVLHTLHNTNKGGWFSNFKKKNLIFSPFSNSEKVFLLLSFLFHSPKNTILVSRPKKWCPLILFFHSSFLSERLVGWLVGPLGGNLFIALLLLLLLPTMPKKTDSLPSLLFSKKKWSLAYWYELASLKKKNQLFSPHPRNRAS